MSAFCIFAIMSALLIIAIILAVLGIVGSVVPALPGPPLSWVGLLLVYIDKGTDAVSTAGLIVWAVVVAAVTVIDYLVPAAMTRAAGGHRAASIGAVVGLFAGIFLTPVGMIGGSLLGAFLGELLVENKGVWDSFKASIGAFAGFMAGTLAKLVLSGIMLWKIIASVI